MLPLPFLPMISDFIGFHANRNVAGNFEKEFCFVED